MRVMRVRLLLAVSTVTCSSILLLILVRQGHLLNSEMVSRLTVQYQRLTTGVTCSNASLAAPDQPGGSPRPVKQVLIVTYGRSGSSLTGDAIHHSKSVYYVFEPLRHLANLYPNTTADVLNGHKVRVLHAFLTCTFTPDVLHNIPPEFVSRYPPSVARCLLKSPTANSRQDTARCVQEATYVCRGYSTVCVKTIRLPLGLVDQLVALNPGLSVIYLFRDPRATVWSRMNVFKSPRPSQLAPYVDKHCRQVEQDVAVARRLAAHLPGRFGFLRYEDLAGRPLAVFRGVYRFLRLAWDDDVAARISQQTGTPGNASVNGPPSDSPASGRPRNATNRRPHVDPYSVTRVSSALAAGEWRRTIPGHVLTVVQGRCRAVLATLGYRLFAGLEEARNDRLAGKGPVAFAKGLPHPQVDLASAGAS